MHTAYCANYPIWPKMPIYQAKNTTKFNMYHKIGRWVKKDIQCAKNALFKALTRQAINAVSYFAMLTRAGRNTRSPNV